MSRWLKIFAVWLVMAALPIQGFAAAVQLWCGPTEHVQATVKTAKNHHHNEGVAHLPSASHDANLYDSGDSALHGDQQASNDGATSCSACAACCVGAGIPASNTIVVAIHSPSTAVLVAPQPLQLGYVPPSLERPPKRISA